VHPSVRSEMCANLTEKEYLKIAAAKNSVAACRECQQRGDGGDQAARPQSRHQGYAAYRPLPELLCECRRKQQRRSAATADDVLTLPHSLVTCGLVGPPNARQSRVAIVMTILGRWGRWMPWYLETALRNPAHDFLIFYDDSNEPVRGASLRGPDRALSNVFLHSLPRAEWFDRYLRAGLNASMEGGRRLQVKGYGAPVSKLLYLYNSVARPLIPIIFKEELRGYDYWGWQDSDVLLGDLEEAYAYHKIQAFDVVGTGKGDYTNGHLSYFRNTQALRRLGQSTRVLADLNSRLANQAMGADDLYSTHVVRANLWFLTHDTCGALAVMNEEWPNPKKLEKWDGFNPHVSWIYDRGSIVGCTRVTSKHPGHEKSTHARGDGGTPLVRLATHVHFGGGPNAHIREGKKRLVTESLSARWDSCIEHDDCTACFPREAWAIA